MNSDCILVSEDGYIKLNIYTTIGFVGNYYISEVFLYEYLNIPMTEITHLAYKKLKYKRQIQQNKQYMHITLQIQYIGL
jgi:hypothetical protein